MRLTSRAVSGVRMSIEGAAGMPRVSGCAVLLLPSRAAIRADELSS
jgi:hypothetical protein